MTTDESLEAATTTHNEFYAAQPTTPSEAMFLESRLRNLSCVLRTARKAVGEITDRMMERPNG